MSGAMCRRSSRADASYLRHSRSQNAPTVNYIPSLHCPLVQLTIAQQGPMTAAPTHPSSPPPTHAPPAAPVPGRSQPTWAPARTCRAACVRANNTTRASVELRTVVILPYEPPLPCVRPRSSALGQAGDACDVATAGYTRCARRNRQTVMHSHVATNTAERTNSASLNCGNAGTNAHSCCLTIEHTPCETSLRQWRHTQVHTGCCDSGHTHPGTASAPRPPLRP